MSPHEIVYGTKLSSPADRLTGQSTEAISTESIKLYIEKMQETWKNVAVNLKKA